MADWEFDDASVAVGEALQVLAVRDEVRLTAEQFQATPPESLRWEFETADTGLADALAIAEQHRYTAQEVQWAQHLTRDDRNPFQVIGLIGEHPEQELADAVAAFEIDDLDAANSIASLVSNRIADAQSVGVSRLVKAVLAVLVLGATIAAVVVWIRRKRRPADATELEPLEEIAVP
jgi:hypothetical protein